MTEKKEKEVPTVFNKPPRQRSPKAERRPVFPWPRSKVAGEAAQEFLAPMKAAIAAGDHKAIERAGFEQRNHPEVIAVRLIEKALQEVHLDPRVHRDAETLGEFVMLMRELLADFVPGMTFVEMLAPLQTALSQHGGGGPPKADPESVMKTVTALEAAWHPAPQKEAAKTHGITDRTARNYAAKKRKKPP